MNPQDQQILDATDTAQRALKNKNPNSAVLWLSLGAIGCMVIFVFCSFLARSLKTNWIAISASGLLILSLVLHIIGVAKAIARRKSPLDITKILAWSFHSLLLTFWIYIVFTTISDILRVVI